MTRRKKYEEVKHLINNKGFELISTEYKSSRDSIIYNDSEGYLYFNCLTSIISNNHSRKFDKGNPYSIQNIKLWLKINNKPYELISKKYNGNTYPLIFKDYEEYMYSVRWQDFMQHKIPERFHTSNPYTIQNINLWCKLNNKSFELLNNIYNGAKENLKWQCLKEDCGEIFEMTWAVILQNHGCPYCNGKQVSLSNCLATKNPKLAKEWHPTKNGELTPYDVTCGSNKEVWWLCKNGHEWEKQIKVRNINGCPYCSHFYPSKEYNLLVINPRLCEEWNYEKNEKKPEEYTPNANKSVWWICRECNHEWKTKIGYRHKNNSSGCYECNQSKGETKIREWLRNYDILFDSQKTFEGLVGLGNGLLSYDFYILKYNLLLEYQGIQHEKYIRGFHKSKKDFDKQVEHDRRKKEYAEQNGYELLEIWYWDFDLIKDVLNKNILVGDIMLIQNEMLKLLKQYNNTDRNTIKHNLKRIMNEKKIKSSDIMNLGFEKNNVYSWTNKGSLNAPLFDQLLTIAVSFNFDVKELLKTD